MTKSIYVHLLAVLLLLWAKPASAACVDPAGNAGDQIYNNTYNVMAYCNGTDWMAMGATNVWTLNGGDTYFNANNVGIGTTVPLYGLDVEKATGATNAKMGSSLPLYLMGNDPALGFNLYYNTGWKFGKSSTTQYGGYFDFQPSTGTLFYGVSTAGGVADAAATMSNKLTILQNGNVGIGTMVPAARLEVAGQVKIAGGSPGIGKVLTSDAAGLATWEVPSASATPNVQIFDASGSWTKPATGTTTFIQCWGGGGGGGGGSGGSTLGGAGGFGGSGGVMNVATVATSSLPGSVVVTLGVGGAGGAGGLLGGGSTGFGTDGTAGGASSFGAVLSASGGAGGHAGWGPTMSNSLPPGSVGMNGGGDGGGQGAARQAGVGLTGGAGVGAGSGGGGGGGGAYSFGGVGGSGGAGKAGRCIVITYP